MLRRIFLLVLLLIAPLAATARTEVITLPDGRSYRIDLPESIANAPLILALHGGGGNPDQFARNTGLSAPANVAGYAVIYPAGSARRGLFLTWNGGYCCGYAAEEEIDDIGFLDRVIADATSRFDLNARRVYITGMSNGAVLAETYAALRPGQIRAVAGVAGTMDARTVVVAGRMPWLHIHGTADMQVPYSGGRGADASTDTDFASVDRVRSAFARQFANRLSQQANVIDEVADGKRVIRSDFLGPQGLLVMRILTIEGGGHNWPGSMRADRTDGSLDVDANAEILTFFNLHP